MKLNQLSAGCVLLCALYISPAAAQTLNEDGTLIAHFSSNNFHFGSSVGISGNTAIVGEKGAHGHGTATLFNVTTGQLLRLFDAEDSDGSYDADFDDFYGYSVAISGTAAIVGAPGNDDAGSNSGSAYLIKGNWRTFKLTASDAQAQDFFGGSVGISGTTAIVGAPWAFENGPLAGSAYLFDTTTGQQLFKLDPPFCRAENSFFGQSVAISGSTAIVGAPGEAGCLGGSAFLFDTTTGQFLFWLQSSDIAVDDEFGTSVAISGTTAIVGAVGTDDGGSYSGSAYIFDTTTGQQLFKLVASDATEGDLFGCSVDISGTTAIVGARGNDDAGSRSGSAYYFDTTTGQQFYKFTASDAEADDEFGTSVAISGTTSIVGAPYEDGDFSDNAGAVYALKVPSKITSQPQSVVVSPGEAAVFTVDVINPGGGVPDYLWRRDGVPMSDGGAISGAQSPAMQIIAQSNDDAFYDCVITNPATIVSEAVVLAVRSDPNPCVADLNDDGQLDFFDISTFLTLFGAGCP